MFIYKYGFKLTRFTSMRPFLSLWLYHSVSFLRLLTYWNWNTITYSIPIPNRTNVRTMVVPVYTYCRCKKIGGPVTSCSLGQCNNCKLSIAHLPCRLDCSVGLDPGRRVELFHISMRCMYERFGTAYPSGTIYRSALFITSMYPIHRTFQTRPLCRRFMMIIA